MNRSWRKSSYSCDSANCVEVAAVDGRVLVRDSKLGNDSPVLTYSTAGWDHLITVLRLVDLFKRTEMTNAGERVYCLTDSRLAHLHVTEGERDAFLAGVRAGEFDVEKLEATG